MIIFIEMKREIKLYLFFDCEALFYEIKVVVEVVFD